jgi:hypothetical protein
MAGRNEPLSPRATIGVGALAAATGLYFMLASLGVLPPPGRANAPMWIVFFAGLVFFLGGVAVIIPAAAGSVATESGELPPFAPRWVRLAQYLLGVTVFASFAIIGSWVAFGPGPRSFSMSMPFFSTQHAGETIGRVAFGIGAGVTWLGTIAVAVSGARKLLRNK